MTKVDAEKKAREILDSKIIGEPIHELTKLIASALLEAVEAEREECAQLAMKMDGYGWETAKAIRSRSKNNRGR